VKPRDTRAFPFRPQQRLTRSAQFGRVMSRAERSADRFFTVLARPNDKNHARLGLAISRKAARRAVDRNRLKRIAREAFRHAPAAPAMDLVVFAKPGAAREDRRTLRNSLDRHLVALSASRLTG